MSALQADTDGRVDVAWLTARADGSERRLSIFWHEGGAFAGERRSLVSEPGVEPRAFVSLPETPGRGPSLVLATPAGLQLRPLEGRELGPAEVLLDMPGATGVTAGDLNGDGTLDLAAAVRGNLIILGAALESL